MTTALDTVIRSVADVRERIGVQGLADQIRRSDPYSSVREGLQRLDAERARLRASLDGASAYARAARLDIPQTIGERALQYVAANDVARIADLQTTAERVLRDVDTTSVVAEARRISDSITDQVGVASRIRDHASYAQEVNRWGAAQAAAMLAAQDSAWRYVRDSQRTLTDTISAMVSNPLAAEIEHIRSSMGMREFVTQIESVAASLRLPQRERVSVDPVVADMLLIFGRRATQREGDAALERIVLWFVQRRLEGHRLSATLRRLDASVLQAAILLVIGSNKFRKLTPRQAKEQMPELVFKKLGERPAMVSERNCPIYKIKQRPGSTRLDGHSTNAGPLDALVAAEDVSDFRRLLSRIKFTRGERETIDLLVIEGLTVTQVARRRRVTPNAVQMQRLRAGKKIAKHLKAQRRRPRR